ncbi:PREDICTED: uncharacterized protein LOC108783603 [Cyphomyrmex costatus]|nr:PREDICTED: uncharacterized protein LOC108783603 [Cyphomyrmex costatus]
MIDLNQGRNVKREVESALKKLRKLQLTSDDVTELLRSICPLQSSYKLETISVPIYDEIISNNGNKVTRRKNGSGCTKHVKNNKSAFIPKKKLVFMIPKNYPELSLQRSIIFTANTVITNASTESTSNKKFKNFTFKKRSEIYIKFQQHHKC